MIAKAEDRKAINILFYVVFITNLMINMDHGIIPACTTEIMEDLDIDSADLGLLGSLVYLGLVIGNYRSFNDIYRILMCNARF
jgi:hypothetical protein